MIFCSVTLCFSWPFHRLQFLGLRGVGCPAVSQLLCHLFCLRCNYICAQLVRLSVITHTPRARAPSRVYLIYQRSQDVDTLAKSFAIVNAPQIANRGVGDVGNCEGGHPNGF